MSLKKMRESPGLIIANPTAGTVGPDLVADLVAQCRRFLPDVEVHWTTGRGDATKAAREAAERTATRLGVVFAVGGDGTVREVVEGFTAARPQHRDGPALMVVPAGTGNSNYLAHWSDCAWPVAVTAALSGQRSESVGAEVRMLDLCRLTQTREIVLLGACSGLIAEALVYARDVPLSGRPRYREALARAAEANRPYPGRVEVDGVLIHEGPTVLANVGGGRYRGGQYKILPRSILDDGLLDVCVIGAETRAADVPELTRHGAHLGRSGVVYASGRRITISRQDGEPLWFEHDGELLPREHAAVTLEVLPGRLPAVCRSGRALG